MILYAHYWTGVDLADALAAYGALGLSPRAIALLYSRWQCRFATCDTKGRLSDEKANILKTNDCFEARVFTEIAEMRWLKNPVDPENRGSAAILSERKLTGFPDDDIEEIPLYQDGYDGRIDQTYLLWGEGVPISTLNDGMNAEWGCLVAARIGRLPVPIPCGDGDHIHLKVREYLGRLGSDLHGNVGVVEERLIGLERVR